MEEHRMVQLALDNRILTMDQVDKAKKEQQLLADRGIERSLWFLLLDMGFVTDIQARDLRKYVSSASIRALEVEGFVLQGRIGSGGMGDVFRAVHNNGKEAAVKLLSSKLAKNPENARRFQREARASMRLKHPHITQSIAAGEVEGQRYLVMELVKGPSLKQRMSERGKLPEDQGIILLWQIAMALKYAWEHGVLHRDVKPANLMLAPPRPQVAEPFCAKICDFGLAKVIVQGGVPEEESKGMLTGAGMALGTPHYMPPEQASGETNLDQRADIYSLAASVYHALLGQTMHNGKSSTIIMYKQVTEAADLEPLRAVGVGEAFIKIMSKMLEKNRKKRYNTWDEVIAGIKQLAPTLIKVQEQALVQSMDSETYAQVPFAAESSSGLIEAPSQAHLQHNNSSTTEQKLVHPTVRMSARKGNKRALLIAGFVGALILATAGMGYFSSTQESGQRVSPFTFAVVLANTSSQPRVLVLEPGDYPGPWRFGVAHSGVTIRALGPGVRVTNAGLPSEVPLVRCDPGLTNFQLIGVELSHASGTALDIMAGVKASFQKGVVNGRIQLNGAELALEKTQLHGSLSIALQGSAHITDSVIHGFPACELKDGRARFVRSRLVTQGDKDGTFITVLQGHLECDAVEMTVLQPREPSNGGMIVGLDLRTGVVATLRDTALRGVDVGLVTNGAQIPLLDGLSIYARQLGVRWQGERHPEWQWQRFNIQAPIPSDGLSITSESDGARPDRLGLVPVAIPVASVATHR
jgi:serine/threonine protein kinase